MITPPSERYLAALRHAHYAKVRVRLFDAGVYVADLNVSRVNLSIDGNADVQRRASVSVGIDIYDPEDRETLEQLTVKQGSITIEHGIVFADETVDWVLLATLRIDESSQGAISATRAVNAADRAVLVQEHLMEKPLPLTEPYASTIDALLKQTLPGEPLTIRGAIDETTGASPGKALVQGDDRLPEMQRFATAIGGWVINDPDGSFVLSQYDPIIESPVWDIDATSDGVMVDMEQIWSRKEIYNAVGITFTPAEEWDGGDKQLYYFGWDNDPLSPTYYNGPFGKRPVFFDEEYDHLPSDTEAGKVADRILDAYTGGTMSVDIESVYNPLLLPSDIVRITFPDGEQEDHVIDVVEHELGPSGRTRIATRLNRPEIIRSARLTSSSGIVIIIRRTTENDSE